MSKTYKPVILVILDGWGHREAHDNNAIAQARTPCWDGLLANYPHGLLNASEQHVGLPDGQMGNSEVGHMNIGSGRILMQDLPRIDAAIADGSLAKNPRLLEFIEKTKAGTGVCHLMGLLSDGGVHSHQQHMVEMTKCLVASGVTVKVHAFLDGRDTPPESALAYVEAFEQACGPVIATVSGRYYAMDRDKRWDRVQAAYDALTIAAGERFASAPEVIRSSYAKQVSDEFVVPSIVHDYQGMQDGDSLFMVNFRADRVRELLTALTNPAFAEFPRMELPRFSATLGMTEYSAQLAPFVPALFAPQPLGNILGEVVSGAGLKQLRIAETEKYAHVTFFFNGGREKEFPGEERILVPSPKVATYDLKPEMSAPEVTDRLVEAITAERFDFIVVNYANTDMVGHTGDIQAAAKAVEAVDQCLDRVVKAALAKDGALLITADHGNAEMMFDDDTRQAHTAHTLNLVPAILVSNDMVGAAHPLPDGSLCDVAPTILQLLNLRQPDEMTGRSLLRKNNGI